MELLSQYEMHETRTTPFEDLLMRQIPNFLEFSFLFIILTQF